MDAPARHRRAAGRRPASRLGPTRVLEPAQPRVRPAPPARGLQVLYFPDEPVAGQHTDLGSTQHDVTLDAPLYQGAADEWATLLRLRNQQFDTAAAFPDSGEPFPDELWNIRFG